MTLLLPKNTVTWQTAGMESTIDLIFITHQLTDRLQRCNTAPELQLGSDHLPVLSEFNTEPVAEEQPIKRRAWKTANTEVIRTRAEELGSNLARAESLLSTPE